jgi:poly(3-hydroxybutyrate) depolymerase
VDAGPPPLAPVREPQPVAIKEWMIAAVSAKDDPVEPLLEAGTFTLPPQGEAFGTFWSALPADESGALFPVNRGELMYAATVISAAKGMHMFGRMDAVVGVYTGGAQQPGDVYAAGNKRVPLAVSEGDNLVVVRGFGGRGTPAAQIFATEDELVFNLADVTTPDLVVGDASEQYVGVAVLNVTEVPARDLVATVEDSEHFTATAITYPSLAAGAVTQVAFQLVPKAPFAKAAQELTVALRLESPSLAFAYRRELKLSTLAAGTTFKRTFRSRVDGSAQYYGVVPPSDFDAQKDYALVLTLHGAAVEGLGQARAYSAKDWAYIVAPTNRRPFGFDWEEWGRLDAIEALDHAMASYRIAKERVYLTGHSMGGHGTWHVGVLFPGRFATVGPSAGWSDFYSYQRGTPPTGVFGRAQAASMTLAYVKNLARRGVYVIHGAKDDNVPVTEAYRMLDALKGITEDVVYYEEPTGGHWWDGDKSPGADCVDWPDLFAFMQKHTLDPTELEFEFVTPSPSVNPTHSYVTLVAEKDPYHDASVVSRRTAEDTVTLTTTNVHSLRLDGAALVQKGIQRAVVDGATHDVGAKELAIGPQDGKRPLVHGPLNDVFRRPFCLVYADDGPPAYRHYAAYLLSNWSLIGNGHGCALPLSRVTSELGAAYNLVYLGVPVASIPALATLPFRWDATQVTAQGTSHPASAMTAIFPDGEHLGAVFVATAGAEYLLYRLQPFSSGFAVPDYLVWNEEGARAAGLLGPDWKVAPSP